MMSGGDGLMFPLSPLSTKLPNNSKTSGQSTPNNNMAQNSGY